jgi:autotransporter-associated beta strand protein
MNGFNQSLPGIAFGSGTAGFSIINNSASTDSTLTFSGLTVDRSFSGAIKDGPTRKISLVMNSAGRAQILNGTSTYSGTTSITAGTLRAGAAAGGQAFGNLSAVALANTSGATLDLNGFNQTVGSLAGGGASGGSSATGGVSSPVEELPHSPAAPTGATR